MCANDGISIHEGSNQDIFKYLLLNNQCRIQMKRSLGYFAMPLPTSHPHDQRKIEECLINSNKGEDDDRCLKFSKKTAKKFTEGLFREYSALNDTKVLMTVENIVPLGRRIPTL